MNCSQVRSLLEEYFEGSLPTAQSEAVAKHLESCAHCQAELVQIERLVTALEAVPAAAPSDELLGRITTQVATLPLPGTRRWQWLGRWRWAAAAAGAGTAAVGGIIGAVAVLIWLGLGSHLPGASWAAGAGPFLQDWVDTVLLALGTLAGQVIGMANVAGLATKTAAPTVGAYVAAEIGILLAIVLVARLSHRREAMQPTVLM